jgi:hypothetical protein
MTVIFVCIYFGILHEPTNAEPRSDKFDIFSTVRTSNLNSNENKIKEDKMGRACVMHRI